ncbi:MAG: SMC-Scp complex subunit ScpB [Lachnospiraceae bacterium]|nr:SMC-Scp complex subunit ScpB [Lachnospiraceae bacterium]MBQ9562517.1 SMC-Scp complex subunit ScpB [Lachnospiraceae bacterium]MBQ9593965.1 SMC-Scp complex subunit ScpB [Lachnospiraceae bacterium]MBR0153991.1 SMC-Scp complex subunit ScpB [Lachnospiraceae bacterium]
MNLSTLEASIEAILFSMGEAVDSERIAVAIEQDAETTRRIIRNMMDRYEAENRGIMIIEMDGSFQMCTKPDYFDCLKKLIHLPKKHMLTEVMLETLSIIAYKQPITRGEIEAIRGVSSDHAINRLIEFRLIEEKGRLNAPGRPIQFGTTQEFLRSFGLQSLDDLPVIRPEKVEDFKLEAEKEYDDQQMELNLQV